MTGLWLKIFDEELFDPRVQRLSASLFKTWVNCLCATSRNGGKLPDLGNLAFLLHTRPGALSRRLDALKVSGLLEEVDGELRPVAFEKRQSFRHDAQDGAEPMSPAERTRRWRERRARDAASVTDRDGSAVTVTALEEEIDQETETQTAPESAGVSECFTEFLRSFPSRDDGDHAQAPALAAFRKAVAAGADPRAIVAAAKAYASATAGRERRYIAGAVRWLMDGRWKARGDDGTYNPAPIASPKITVKRDSPAGEAWEAHRRAIEGKGYPWVNGRWFFDTEFPPAPLEQAA